MYSILQRHKDEDESRLFDSEKGIANKWRWEWLEKTELDPSEKFAKLSWTHGPIKIVAKDHIRKIDEPGKAICSLCPESAINYSVSGLKSIVRHLSTQKHLKLLGTLYGNQMLPGASGPSSDTYGAPTDFYGATPPASMFLSPKDTTPTMYSAL